MTQVFVWTIGDVFQVVVFGLVFVCVLLLYLIRVVEEWRCKHDAGVTENQYCNAICCKCGKNLGFIEDYRK